jgi:phosphate transport system permease protein
VNESSKSFTGRRRARSTHWSVKVKDRIARTIITIGGLGTIVAVSTVCIFLVAVVIPLFRAPDTSLSSAAPLPTPDAAAEGAVPVHVAVDDYNLMAWAVFKDGVVRKFRLDNGEVLDEVALADDAPLTAWSFPQRDDLAVFGYADGSVRYATIKFNLRFFELDEAPEMLRRLEPGEVATHEKGLVQMTQERQLRHVTLDVELQDPVQTGADQPVTLLDHTGSRNEINYVAMTADGRIFLQRARGRRNMLTGAITYRVSSSEVPYDTRPERPAFVKLTGLGDNLYIIWQDGLLYRMDTRDLNEVRHMETVDLSPSADVAISSIGFMIGKTTLLAGDTAGNVTGWFRVRPDALERDPDLTLRMRQVALDAEGVNQGAATAVRVADIQTPDQLALVPAQHLPGPVPASPVRTLSASQRKRMFVAGHADGRIRVHNATVLETLFELQIEDGQAVEVAAFNPRDDGLIGVSSGGVALWNISVPHSEATWAAYFRPVWYEGYSEPLHVWQSTGGTDDFESKFGLMPLIFGTIKATFYSMMFAVPLALLAAIYTSEFLHPRLKMKIKPSIEMMASLPSVVLGFLAGLVIAQFIESRVPTVLMAFITIPMALIMAACVWQLLPRAAQIRLQNVRFLMMLLVIPVGVWMAAGIGPVFERAFFSVRILDPEIAGQLTSEMAEADIEVQDGTVIVRDFRTWLSAHRQNPAAPSFDSSPVGGWMILFMPFSLLISIVLAIRYVNPVLIDRTSGWSRAAFAWLDFGKFVAVALGALLVAYLLSTLFGWVWDPRGSYIDQYVQRNALVVGFIMGFAVVPIIYTIADDAMSAVPEHLRSASLGAGATRWQTAVRIIVPTAMSGLFSAVMIGFGRAVGETMIVLMAAGNTPIMEWNIFSGFRTLSANIAVEMMEAVEGSTNYRTLFLAAVILFAMTFAINTVAETVRQRYRKRAYEL